MLAVRLFTRRGIMRSFYQQTGRVTGGRSQGSSAKSRQSEAPTITGFRAPKVQAKATPFNEIENLSDRTSTMFKERGFEKAFPVQVAAFEPVFSGQNLIVKEKTGSGKTIAYSLPVLERLRKEGRLGDSNGPRPKVVILVPTRELCLQVNDEINQLQHHSGEFKTVALYGGVQIGAQINDLARGADIAVATPGRLADLIERGAINLSNVETLILDETDEMLNIGFKEKINSILEEVKQNKYENPTQKPQFLLFSATIPTWVKNEAATFMGKDFSYLELVEDADNATPLNTKHYRLEVDSVGQAYNIASTLANKTAVAGGRCIIFTGTKAEASELVNKGHIVANCRALHGDIDQRERSKTFQDFKSGKANVIVATNVAARGLDFPDVDLVIQLHPPEDIESYIHRSGRTGRAGKDGASLILHTAEDKYKIGRIEQIAKVKFQQHPPVAIEDKADMHIKLLMSHLASVSQETIDQSKTLCARIQKEFPEDAIQRLLAVHIDRRFKYDAPVRKQYGGRSYTGSDQSYGGGRDGGETQAANISQNDGEMNFFIGNVTPDLNFYDVTEALNILGITDVNVRLPKSEGVNKGFGFINTKNPSAARLLMNMRNLQVKGNELKIERSRTRE